MQEAEQMKVRGEKPRRKGRERSQHNPVQPYTTRNRGKCNNNFTAFYTKKYPFLCETEQQTEPQLHSVCYLLCVFGVLLLHSHVQQ